MPTLPARSASLVVKLAILGLVLALGNGRADAADDVYVVDKGHSSLQFKIKHMGVSYTHGRFNDFSGSFKFNLDNPAGCSIEIDVNTDSIDSNDDERDKHLRSAEYFNCEKFPSMSFKSTKIEKTGDAYRVTGNLTILAVTKSVTMRMKKVGEGKDPWGGYRMGFDGSLMIKRSEYGMTAKIPGIGDEVYLTLGIEGIKHDPSKKKK